jgi:oligopeptide transport system ATP-binding protein
MSAPPEMLIEAAGLTKDFSGRTPLFGKAPPALRAVDHVSLTIRRGQTLGLVGESGCGKSTLGRLLIRLLEPTGGTLRFDGQDITHLDAKKLRPLRSRFQMVFQDPFGSLSPRLRIGHSIAEPLLLARRGTAKERREKTLDLLRLVGLAPDHAERYPHEFSGGQKQRICIARALILNPDLIVADEPVSALDVSVRAQIINLFQDLKERFGLAYLFISHDLTVVRHIADQVAVMYLGQIVERGPAADVIDRPAHPYSQALRAATPLPRPGVRAERKIIKGDLPDPMHMPTGCRFRDRCPAAFDRCRVEEPALRPAGAGREAACHLY